MAPRPAKYIPLQMRTTTSDLKAQWVLPKDIFSILLLLGGEVVARALAQLVGPGLTPVTFSFGWVAYSITALASAVGENKLMPAPDCKCKVINGKTGFTVENSSWVLGRMARDFPKWCQEATTKKLAEVLDSRWSQLKESDPGAAQPTRAGLVITVYQPSMELRAQTPRHDYIYWIGTFVMSLQLGIAALPLVLYGNWGILMITSVGTGLALLTGLLPQWRKEKWACRSRSNDTYILTRGNGAQHCIVILGNGHGLNLEDLAGGPSNMEASVNKWTRAAVFGLSAAWVLLLVTAAGLNEDTWFLFGVGGIGMLQNVVAAGTPRRPENFGIPLEFVEVFGQQRVMSALLEVEEHYPLIGRSIRDEFFPGQLKEEEIIRWEELENREREEKGAQDTSSDSRTVS